MKLRKNCWRIGAVLPFLALMISAGSARASVSSVYSPLSCPGVTKSSSHVTVHSGKLWYNQKQARFTGYTFYPADAGGTPAWHSSGFKTYIGKTLANESYLGANLVRPTDQFDNITPGQKWDDPTVWSNMDYLVCQAAKKKTFVALDLSFMAHILTSQGKNVTDAANWLPMIGAVAQHYAGWQPIAWVSFYGEPAYPSTAAATTTLASFYARLLAEYHRYDSGHVLTPGGLTHTMYGYPNWWQSVDSVKYSQMLAYEVYSLDDQTYLPTISAWTSSTGKALVNGEFGMPQSQGDSIWSGQTYNGLMTDRADFYAWNYQRVFSAAIFWNDSCLVGATDYDVNPQSSPAVIQQIRTHSAVPPTSKTWSGWSC